METIQIQSVGKVPAIPASQLKINDSIVFNFGHTAKITSISRITKSFITFTLFDNETQSNCERRFKKSRLVAIKKDSHFFFNRAQSNRNDSINKFF